MKYFKPNADFQFENLGYGQGPWFKTDSVYAVGDGPDETPLARARNWLHQGMVREATDAEVQDKLAAGKRKRFNAEPAPTPAQPTEPSPPEPTHAEPTERANTGNGDKAHDTGKPKSGPRGN